jgi:hypothetical protein
VKIARSALTLYIDTDTHLLVRAQAHLVWRTVPGPRSKKPSGTEYSVTFTETHLNTTLDKPIPAAEFEYTPGKQMAFKP